MAALVKKPLQIYLQPEQLDALRQLATDRDTSMAALIRAAIDNWLAQQPLEEDALFDIVALGDSGLGDLAERHDDYLAEEAPA